MLDKRLPLLDWFGFSLTPLFLRGIINAINLGRARWPRWRHALASYGAVNAGAMAHTLSAERYTRGVVGGDRALRAPEVMTFVIHFALICRRIFFVVAGLFDKISDILRLGI
jgi:hypothetical protein